VGVVLSVSHMMLKPLKVSASRLHCTMASEILYSSRKYKVWKMFKLEKSKVKFILLPFCIFFLTSGWEHQRVGTPAK